MESNLRRLFKRGGHHGGSVAYDKEAGAPCYVIGAEGENILMVEKPSRVWVPVVEYDSDVAVLDRLGALLWVSCGGSDVKEPAFPRVSCGSVVEALRGLLRRVDLDLAGLVIGTRVGRTEAWLLESGTVPCYGPCFLGDEPVVLGVGPPEFLGEVAEVSYTINGVGVWASALSVTNPRGVVAVRLVT
jgi:hypothetical protein